MSCTIINTENQDIDELIEIRLETIRNVENLSDDYIFSNDFIENTRHYLETSNHDTILAVDGENVIGCASLCYIRLMPTFSHPTGKRGHIMNVYVKKEYRRQGIALNMIDTLIKTARNNGCTELSLDATAEGRALYEKCGFAATTEGMVLVLNKN